MTENLHTLSRQTVPVAVLFALLLIPSPAKGCSADCKPTATCHGGCSITPGPSCGASCEDGVCDFRWYECYETGIECPIPMTYVTGQCHGSGDPGDPVCPNPPCLSGLSHPEHGASIWVVVDFEVEAGTLAGGFEVLAESQPHVGALVFQRHVVDRDWLSRASADGRYRFVWARPAGRCAKVEGELLHRQAPFASAKGKSYFVFDVRIDANGAYMAIEPLYSDVRDLNRNAAQFLRENLRLSTREERLRSLQVFVGLTVDEAGNVGYFIAAAGELL